MEACVLWRNFVRLPQEKGAGKRTAGGGGGWAGKAALVLSLLALTVSGVALYLLLFGEKEPEYLTYRDQQLLVLEDVDRNQYDPEDFSTDSQGGSTSPADAGGAGSMSPSIRGDRLAGGGQLRCGVCHDPGGLPGLFPGRLQLDERFQENMAGRWPPDWMGVYFFSQATSVLEAEEEADFVLSAIRATPSSTRWSLIGSSSMGRRPAPTGWTGRP